MRDNSIYLDKLLQEVRNKFSLSDYEVDFLKELNIELRKPLPSTRLGLEERVNVLDMYKLELHNILYMLENKFNEISYQYREKYNQNHSRLVRMGRPSEAAIDAEIWLDKGLKSQRDLLQDWEVFKNLLTSYLSTIKSCKESCMYKVV